ncbi:MAG: YheT family hydrolase [Cyanobacteriota bacterium]|jgi:predicted alpha/beta-fold hydrolase
MGSTGYTDTGSHGEAAQRSSLLQALRFPDFRQRFPWVGPDLQTLRDTLRGSPFPEVPGSTLVFRLPEGGRLLARLDHPGAGPPLGVVFVLHGLGGGSDALGPRRLARSLGAHGFTVIRLNLRGAGPGRDLAPGTYAANCTRDLLPVFAQCRRLATEWAAGRQSLPFAAVGISLGGTVLLNALLAHRSHQPPLLNAVACVSSPLDLLRCTEHFEQPRNRIYERWLVARLIAQTLADCEGLTEAERQGLTGPNRPKTIRGFDALITAPRWGFADVATYYGECSPLHPLCESLKSPLTSEWQPLPPLLLVHAKDDPWVPVDSTLLLAKEVDAVVANGGSSQVRHLPEVVITETGGHNGFHAPGDSDQGCWSDRLVSHWLGQVVGGKRTGFG